MRSRRGCSGAPSAKLDRRSRLGGGSCCSSHAPRCDAGTAPTPCAARLGGYLSSMPSMPARRESGDGWPSESRPTSQRERADEAMRRRPVRGAQ
eukprot:6278378-Prymnesium_polylepis.1